MVTKKKAVKRPASQVSEVGSAAALDARLGEMAALLRRIATTLEKIAASAGGQRVVSIPTRQGPDGVLEHFLDGQWHRRSGDVYAKVAEPGSPNAGETESDEQAS